MHSPMRLFTANFPEDGQFGGQYATKSRDYTSHQENTNVLKSVFCLQSDCFVSFCGFRLVESK